MQLAELHLHLDGSLRESTLRALAAPLGADVPADLRFTAGMGLAGAIARAAEHPLPRWLELGVRAWICCDNTLLSDTNAREERDRARAIPGMTDELVARAVAHGHAGAFRRTR